MAQTQSRTTPAQLRRSAQNCRDQAAQTLDWAEAQELNHIADRCDAQADTLEASQDAPQTFLERWGILIALSLGIAFWLALTALFAVHYYG